MICSHALFLVVFAERLLRAVWANIDLLMWKIGLWFRWIDLLSPPSTWRNVWPFQIHGLCGHILHHYFFLELYHFIFVLFRYWRPIHLSHIFPIVRNFLVLLFARLRSFLLFFLNTENLPRPSQILKHVRTRSYRRKGWQFLLPLSFCKNLSLPFLSNVMLLLHADLVILESVVHHAFLLQRLMERSNLLKLLFLLFEALLFHLLFSLGHLDVERFAIRLSLYRLLDA